jgi:hypothetical protein
MVIVVRLIRLCITFRHAWIKKSIKVEVIVNIGKKKYHRKVVGEQYSLDKRKRYNHVKQYIYSLKYFLCYLKKLYMNFLNIKKIIFKSCDLPKCLKTYLIYILYIFKKILLLMLFK